MPDANDEVKAKAGSVAGGESGAGPTEQQQKDSLKNIKFRVEVGYYSGNTLVTKSDSRRYRGRFRLGQAQRFGTSEGAILPDVVPGIEIEMDGKSLTIHRMDPLNRQANVKLKSEVMSSLNAMGVKNRSTHEDTKSTLSPMQFASLMWELALHVESGEGKVVSGSLPSSAELLKLPIKIQFRQSDLEVGLDGTRYPDGRSPLPVENRIPAEDFA